jgi:hypothetical protein
LCIAAADAAPSPPTDSSWSPQFKNFAAKHALLTEALAQGQARLDKMNAIARRADALFARYTPGAAADFADHAAHMLGRLDVLVGGNKALLTQLLDLRAAAAPLPSPASSGDPWRAPIGLPDDFASAVTGIFDGLAAARQRLDAFETHDLSAAASSVALAYRASEQRVADICAPPDRFARTRALGVTSFAALIDALQQWCGNLAGAFAFVAALGADVFEQQQTGGKLAGDDEGAQVLAQLDAEYAKLADVVQGVASGIKPIVNQADGLFKYVADMQADVETYLAAVVTVSKLCRDIKTSVIAASRVGELCNQVKASIGPFEGLLTQHGVQADGAAAPGDAAAAMKAKIDAELSKPVDATLRSVASVTCAGMKALLDRFFDLSAVKQTMSSLETTLKSPPTTRAADFDRQLQQTLRLVEPKKAFSYALPRIPPSASPSPTSPPLPPPPPPPSYWVPNPLVDDAAAKTTGTVFHEITALMHQLKRADGSPVSPRLPDMPEASARSSDDDDDITVVKAFFLLQWGEAWDDAEPKHPSDGFMTWYSLLEALARLMKRRQTWQRLDTASPAPPPPPPPPQGLAPPATLSGAALDLWQLLEAKATVGGSLYEASIAAPLQKPLHDRIDQLLLDGVVQLPTGGDAATRDILKLLPPAPDGVDAQSEEVDAASKLYSLSQQAQAFVESAFVASGVTVSGALAEALADLAEVVDVVADLRPLLLAAGNSEFPAAGFDAQAAVKAVEEICYDEGLMVARRLLERTGDEAMAKRFVERVGVEHRLK